MLMERLTHVKEIVEDRWSALWTENGIWWGWLVGELDAGAREDMECTLTLQILNTGCKTTLVQMPNYSLIFLYFHVISATMKTIVKRK